jgi:hypothetical protein
MSKHALLGTVEAIPEEYKSIGKNVVDTGSARSSTRSG